MTPHDLLFHPKWGSMCLKIREYISATRHPIQFMFGFRVWFLESADRMVLFPVHLGLPTISPFPKWGSRHDITCSNTKVSRCKFIYSSPRDMPDNVGPRFPLTLTSINTRTSPELSSTEMLFLIQPVQHHLLIPSEFRAALHRLSTSPSNSHCWFHDTLTPAVTGRRPWPDIYRITEEPK